VEDLNKSTVNLSQDIRSLGRDLNPVPPEYETVALFTRSGVPLYFTEWLIYKLLIFLSNIKICFLWSIESFVFFVYKFSNLLG
jgi:hypothetical protein